MARMYSDHPELTRTMYVPLLRKHFGRFYQDASLSAAQIESFESLLAEGGPLLEMFLTADGSTSDEDLERVVRAEWAQSANLVAAVSDLLGAETGQKFDAALRVAGVRRFVDQVVVQSFYADAPLSAMQVEQLTRVFLAAAAEQNRLKPELELMEWTQLISSAAGFLTPPQVQSLEAMQAKAAFDREYRRATGFVPATMLPPIEP